MSAQSVQLIEIDGKSYRKADGPARFLHNDTWLICDTALWNVDDQMIHAYGHVSIEQEETELRGDSLVYIVAQDLAKFRGHVVELSDKDGNILRTSNLDYNTKDSVAVFRDGGSMKDNNGQVIESVDGTYESKIKLFTFRDKVEMFTDSVFIKTSLLLYDTKEELATFPQSVEAWKEDKTLSAERGWYRRDIERFFFTSDVHIMSEDKEGWCDSLFFNKIEKEVELLGNAQVTDTVRSMTSLAGRMHYADSVSKLMLTLDPVVIMKLEDEDAYTRADTIYYWTQKRCDVDSILVALAAERKKQINVDPVANIRAKAAEELAKKIKEAEENDPNRPPELAKKHDEGGAPPPPPSTVTPPPSKDALSSMASAKDTLARSDTLSLSDTLSRADSALVENIVPDTTKVGFLQAGSKVKMWRRKMQMVCDSLMYSDLDSIVRMFKSPVVWNGSHQYTSDSLFVVIDSGKMRKANLLSNAFINVEEERDIYYDQIRATEMMAYFDDTTALSRFDALGSVTALFYFKEKERIATANRKECSMMSAEFNDGQISRISYYEAPKSNAYPVAQMRADEKRIKGYSWLKELRPKSPSDLTSRVPRKSQRSAYSAHPRTVFEQTDIYFPGYFEQVYRDIARSDSLRRAAAAAPVPSVNADAAADSLASDAALAGGATAAGAAVAAGPHADSLAVAADSLAKADSLSAGDSVAAAPVVPPGYMRVFPDDSTHCGTLGLGHVSLLDSAKVPVKLDSLHLELYVDTTDALRCLPDTLPPAAVMDTTGKFIPLDSMSMSLIIIPLDKQEIKRMEADRLREARRKAREEKRAAAMAAREAKWKALDEKDAARKAAKEAEKQAREKERQRKYLESMARQQAKEIILKEAYKAKYLKKIAGPTGLDL